MTSQYGAYALRAGLARLYARMCMHSPTRLGTHMHARTHKHAHTDQYVILIVFPQQQWFRELASMLRDTYFACFVYTSKWYIISLDAEVTAEDGAVTLNNVLNYHQSTKHIFMESGNQNLFSTRLYDCGTSHFTTERGPCAVWTWMWTFQ
jgi:hypothetical protein